MKAFVTGATGLLGSNLVKQLLAQGYIVKALVRSQQKAEQFLPHSSNLSLIEGDMENVSSFAEHLRGIDVLFHTAAYFREAFSGIGDHWDKLQKINVTETIRLFEIAEAQGVGRIIHTSSVASIAALGNEKLATEADLAAPEQARELYAKSKILGDQAIAEFCKTHSIPVITVHPSWMFGPGDAAPTAGGRFILDFLAQKLPGIITHTGIEVVDVRDVAQVMIKAALTTTASDRFIASGHFVSIAELCAVLEQVTGIPAPKRQLPVKLVLAIAWFSERWAAFRKEPALLTVNSVRSLTGRKRVSVAKAERELGVTFQPLAITMSDAVQWYLQNQPERLNPEVRQAGLTSPLLVKP
jgi:dihydroflavonol-4-reductase